MMVILMSFLLSCVAQFAQYHQMTIDSEEIAKLKQKLLSSSTGSLSLSGTPFTSPLNSVGTGSVRSLRPNSYPSGYSTSITKAYSPPPAHLYPTGGSGLGASLSPAMLSGGGGAHAHAGGSGVSGGGGSSSSTYPTVGAGLGSVRSSFVASLSSALALSGEAQSKNTPTEHTKDDTSKKRE